MNGFDLLTVRRHLGESDAQGAPQGDVTGDGRVNAADLHAVRAAMRAQGASPALAVVAPEPSSLLMMAAASPLILRRRG